MFTRLFILLFCFSVSASTFSQQADNQIFVDLDSYSYSEPTSLASFTNKFNGDLDDGDHAVSSSQLVLGVNYEKFSFSVIKRLDYFYKFTNDTARFYSQTENNVPFVSQQRYQLELQMSHFEASGLKVAYQWQLGANITLAIAGSYFNASDFYQARLQGEAVWQGLDDFQVDAPAEIYSAHNELLQYPETDAKGEGVSLDVALAWRINPQWQFALSINDAFSRIYWQDALFSQINRWQVYRLTENGQLDTAPVLEGRVVDYQQELPKKWRGKINYTTETGTHYYSKIYHTRYFSHYQLGINKPINENNALFLAWHIQARAIELGYVMPYGYIRFMTDSWHRKQAHAFALSAGFSLPF
ncbi:MAG: hypothetical protein ACI9C4_003020 [Paraglaciecola sp.]|jgi:hypothetical protein